MHRTIHLSSRSITIDISKIIAFETLETGEDQVTFHIYLDGGTRLDFNDVNDEDYESIETLKVSWKKLMKRFGDQSLGSYQILSE